MYGLGSECDDLPGFVVLTDSGDNPPGGNRNWGTGFMPAAYQGTKFRDGKLPILHVAPPDASAGARQRGKLDFIQQLNRDHLRGREEDNELEARIASYELAFRMQAAAPEAIDLAGETAETRGCTAWTKRRPAATAATACWRGGWSSAACASCSSTWARAASGTPTPTSRAITRCTAARATGRSPACSKT